MSVLLLKGALSAAPLFISEIHFHPVGTNVLEEWFELHNPNPMALDASGWHVRSGVSFTFPAGTRIEAGGFLVVAADTNTFTRLNPGVAPVVGGWTGTLSDSGESIAVEDGLGNQLAQVTYATQGDWAIRRLAAPDRYQKRGWEWFNPADGGGHTLELTNESLPTDQPHNWSPSTLTSGTPGRANSTAVTNSAPILFGLHHSPPIPKPTDTVTISLRILDESATGIIAQLFWRTDATNAFNAVALRDDGISGDGLAGDGLFAARLPAQPEHTLVEFRIEVRDATGNVRHWPAFEPTPEKRSPYFVYQVDSSADPGTTPFYRLIASREEREFLENQVWNGAPLSDAEINGAFIASDGLVSDEGTPQVRQLASFRNRGHGTRYSVPHNFLVKFPDDRRWRKRDAINLNSQYTPGQSFGSAVFRTLGLPMPESKLVQIRWNGSGIAGTAAPQWDRYAANEAVDNTFLERQLPADPDGNLYRGIRDFNTTITPNLVWHGADPSAYTNAYFKENHTLENEWSDLLHLIDVLNNTPAANYPQTIRATLDVEEWIRYFAVNSLLDNQETCLGTGIGDDYMLYFPARSRLAQVLPYDLDSILGGGTTSSASNTSLFKAADVAAVARFLKHPDFAPLYHRELRRLANTFFDPSVFDPFLDLWSTQARDLPGLAQLLKNLKAVNASRVAFVRAQSPSRLTATTSLAVSQGYPKTTAATASLSGQADAAFTASVRVNGVSVPYSPWEGTWSAPSVALAPGIHRVAVEAFDPAGNRLATTSLAVWRDDGSVASKSGTIGANETWTAAGGPYLLAGNLTIAAGSTLTLEPGTTLYLASGVNLTVASGGRLLAEGTATDPIWIGRAPGATATWGGIVINGTAGSPETRIAHAYVEGNGTTCIHSAGGTLLVDHVVFGTPSQQYISLDDSSFVVSHCHFPQPTAAFEPLHGTGGIKTGGHGLFLGNFIGAPNGYNDVIDFTGGNRPGQPIAHFIGNVLAGGGDDGFDLDGTDAWVEGNILLHIHRNGAPDSSAAVSGGSNTGATSEVTLINNLFFDCDNAVTAKQGNFFSLLHNTIVRTTRDGGVDFASGIVNIRDTTPDTTTPGRGFYLEGNIITDAESLVRNPVDSAPVTFINNLLPTPWNGPGSNNVVADARLRHIPTTAETQFLDWDSAQILWDWFTPFAGSPASGAGFGARNLGASRLIGVQIAGEPEAVTRSDAATLWVGPLRNGNGIPTDGFPQGSGYTAYRWRLDGGAWSAEIPVSDPIRLTGLTPGSHQVEVSGRRDTGLWQDDPLLGDFAVVSRSRTWTVDPTLPEPPVLPSLRLNEILAINAHTLTNGLTTPDWIELHNSGPVAIDLAGISLSDSVTTPRKFTFASGVAIPAGGFLVVFADHDTNAPGIHLGFSLKASGDNLLLTDAPIRGGAVLDSIAFGIQAADLAIGRAPDGTWTACIPTPGVSNLPSPLGSPSTLRLNEWLASARFTTGNDFVELFNPGPAPVALGGLRLSDAAASPDRFTLADLSFIAARGSTLLIADGQPGQGTDHLPFSLRADGSVLRLSNPDDVTLDQITFGPQRTDISEGRSPDGSGRIIAFDTPTPGSPNPGTAAVQCVPAVETVPLLSMDATWRYQQTSNLDGTSWRLPAYNDSAWPTGIGLLAVEDCNCLPAPGIHTTLTLGRTTYYFRTRFIVDRDLTGFTLNLSTVLDDGAVIYLNGTAVAWPGMTANTVPTYSTLATRNVGNATVEFLTVPANVLVQGINTLAVEVHQTGTTSSDIVWGAALEAVRTYTNCTASATMPVVINEVFAHNLSRTNANGQVHDWIELYNPSTNTVALDQASLSDDPTQPRRWVFPQGSRIPPLSWLAIRCDPLTPSAPDNTGFGLNASGGQLLLFDAPAHGGSLLDSVRYGLQAADFAIGRVPDGAPAWHLTVPGEALPNSAAGLGNPERIRVNEWMADPASGEDWFELVNTDERPTSIAGLFLTDDLNSPYASPVAPLSFLGIGTAGFRQFFADGQPTRGANHAGFSLKKSGEAVGLFSASGQLLDAIQFGPQQTGISQGRYPDANGDIRSFAGSPTPGSPNSILVVTDADQDGLPDAWELAHGFNPSDPLDAHSDSDGDGVSNLNEYLAGTDPRDASSVLALAVKVATAVTLEFKAIAGRTYAVEWLTDLASPWQRLQFIPAPAIDGPVVLEDSSPGERRFYRIITPASP